MDGAERGAHDAGEWGYVVPWGKIHPGPRTNLLAALREREEGGTGQATAFREWADVKVGEFE